MTRGQMCMCAPERIDSPIASASSWRAARDDLFRRLPEPGVDDFHAGVTQGARDDLRAAVVPVETGLGDDDSDFAHG